MQGYGWLNVEVAKLRCDDSVGKEMDDRHCPRSTKPALARREREKPICADGPCTINQPYALSTSRRESIASGDVPPVVDRSEPHSAGSGDVCQPYSKLSILAVV
jgi:hypothetical protein